VTHKLIQVLFYGLVTGWDLLLIIAEGKWLIVSMDHQQRSCFEISLTVWVTFFVIYPDFLQSNVWSFLHLGHESRPLTSTYTSYGLFDSAQYLEVIEFWDKPKFLVVFLFLYVKFWTNHATDKIYERNF
jgi:hypothetical protein